MKKKKEKTKDPAAVALGRKGGLKRAKLLTKKQRSEAARKAVEVRWKRAKGTPPADSGTPPES